VVVDVGERSGEAVLELVPRPALVGAIDVDRGEVAFGQLRKVNERRVADGKLDAARHRVGVGRDGIDVERPQHAGQRDLRTDAIAVGAGVGNHDDTAAFQRTQERGEAIMEFRVVELHDLLLVGGRRLRLRGVAGLVLRGDVVEDGEDAVAAGG